MITLLNTGLATLGVVPEIPQDAESIYINGKGNLRYLEEDVSGSNGDPIYKEIILPPGNWSILGWSDNLIQEKLWEIGILDYEAWALFLASNGITERKLILKQVI